MSLGYQVHSRTRYLRNHYEIYDYRKEKETEQLSYEASRQQRELALEARQQERKEALEALIEANRAYTPSSRLTLAIEEESRQKRLEKEKEREKKAKQAADRAADAKLKHRLASRSTFNTHLSTTREERTTRLEKQAQFNKIERERRAKEREARSYARSGLSKLDDSDSEEEKSRSTASSRPSATSNRLISKYRDAPEPSRSRYQRTERSITTERTERPRHSRAATRDSEPAVESSADVASPSAAADDQ